MQVFVHQKHFIPLMSTASRQLTVHMLPLQAFVSRARVESFSLTADMMYVSSNAPRIARAVFEICLRRGWSSTAELALMLAKVG